MSSKKKWSNIFANNLADSISYDKVKNFSEKSYIFTKTRSTQDPTSQNSTDKSRFFYFLIIIIFLLFVGRLFYLTIIQGSKNRILAEENRIQLVSYPQKRGKIFDRFGQALAQSDYIYLLKKDYKVTQISEEQSLELENQSLASENYQGELGQIFKQVQRQYDLGKSAAHLLGYTTNAGQNDLENDPKISSVSQVGRLGIEQSYDNFLQGKPGKKIIEVDAFGKKISILGDQEPKNGQNVHLTIDANMQKKLYEILSAHLEKTKTLKAAAVVQNPESGEVLALISMPIFDPSDVAKSLNDKDEPFINRVVQGTYPPGSIFKLVTALAGLESGSITKDSQIEDVGEFNIGDTRFANWYFLQYEQKDGLINIIRAIARSNDIFFYRLAEKTGLEAIRKMAIKFGFGQKTGIDLPNEELGLVPDEKWKQSAFSSNWYLGDTLHLGIGQGFMLATPIQVNSLIASVASGKFTRPYIVSKIEGENNQDIELGGKIIAGNITSPTNLNIIREGMKQACQTGGTGWPFFNATYAIGCKTGTAEKALGNPHAWFSAYAPFNNPQVSVTVIIEDGGEGSSVAGPVARQFLDWYFQNRK